MKRLPKVFANPIDKDINNNRSISKSNDLSIEKNEYSLNDINKKIASIFSSYNYVYKADVLITTTNGEFVKRIIGKKDNNLITLDNELIDISTIKDIKIANKKTSD